MTVKEAIEAYEAARTADETAKANFNTGLTSRAEVVAASVTETIAWQAFADLWDRGL